MTDSFLSRWAKRKAEVQLETKEEREKLDSKTKEQLETPLQNGTSTAQGSVETYTPADGPAEVFKGPTMEDVKNLTKESDFSAFVAKDVDPNVQQAAMKTLFSDPHFNVMDGLDIYIDDYSKPDPLPPGMLEKMVQSSMLGLFKSKLEDELAPSSESSIQASIPESQLKESKALESDALDAQNADNTADNTAPVPNLELSKNPQKKSES